MAAVKLRRNIETVRLLPFLTYWNVTEFDLDAPRPFPCRTIASGFAMTTRKAQERALRAFGKPVA